MRLLACENIPRVVVDALRQSSHHIQWVRRIMPGATDVDVLERAVGEARLALTFDIELAITAARRHMPARGGVIVLRMPLLPPAELAECITTLLASRTDWPGHIALVEADTVRLIPLAGA